MRCSRGRRGFTLIELLTVIGIIAVLAAILFPVFNRVRAKSYGTRCLSNLKQLATAFDAYMADTGGFFPPWCVNTGGGFSPSSPPATEPGAYTWDRQIMSYANNNDIMKCPANPNSNGKKARAYTIAHYTQTPISGAITIPNSWVALKGCYRDNIPAPSRTVLLYEKGAWLPTAWGDALGQNIHQSHNAEGQAGYTDKLFHEEGKNILYCDGHAKLAKAGQYPFNWIGRSGAEAGDVWVAAPQSRGGDWPPKE